MKIAKFFAVTFAVIGTVLLIGSMGFFLLNQDAPVRVLQIPQEAVARSDDFAKTLNAGDLEAAAVMIYGQPDLGVEGQPDDPESAIIWEAFLKSISFEFIGKCYAADNGFSRDATITILDVASVTKKLPERTQSLMNQKIASAGALEEIYDHEGHFREDLVDQILQEALQQALVQDSQTVIRNVTVKLIQRDGAWWVVPDQVLLQAVSGLA